MQNKNLCRLMSEIQNHVLENIWLVCISIKNMRGVNVKRKISMQMMQGRLWKVLGTFVERGSTLGQSRD